MKFDNQLRYAINITEDYKGEIPLAAWLKDFFRANRQMGSKDRKTVAELLYNYYRLGHALKGLQVKEKMLAAVFLCNDAPMELLEYFKPEWNSIIYEPLDQKIKHLQDESSAVRELVISEIFPFTNDLSEGIDPGLFNLSFLIQPDVFLRLRPGKEATVSTKLTEAAIPFKQPAKDCISLRNATKLDEVIELDSEAVIQDFNSQKTGEFIRLVNHNLQPKIKTWDSCAASGGKSIMAYDINPAMQLTVSDLRPAIIENLHKRFERAGIKSYSSFVADHTTSAYDADFRSGSSERGFDLIIADLPCTGSGTWSRTPEQLFFFRKEKIVYYADLQKKIINQLLRRLNPGGCLLYITCSVFKQENEEIANYIINRKGKLVKMELLKGYDKKADSMFAAVFTL